MWAILGHYRIFSIKFVRYTAFALDNDGLAFFAPTLLAARTLLDFMGGVTMANNDVMTWDSNIPNEDRNILAVDRSIPEKSLVSVRTPEFEFNEVLGERVLRYVPWVGEAFGASRAQKVGALAVQI